MKTLGEVAQAFARMEALSKKLNESTEQLERAMFPEERTTLQEKRVAWQLEYDALYATPLTDTPVAATTLKR